MIIVKQIQSTIDANRNVTSNTHLLHNGFLTSLFFTQFMEGCLSIMGHHAESNLVLVDLINLHSMLKNFRKELSDLR